MAAPATLGLAEHSGWAVLVALGGTPLQPVLLTRRRIELVHTRPARLPVQPFHASASLPADEAADLVGRVRRAARRNARRELARARDELAARGHPVAGAAVAIHERDDRLPPLDRVLRSHPLLHAAEGELYRDCLAHAASGLGLAVTRYLPGGLTGRAAAAVGTTPEALQAHLRLLGRAVGPPWQKDQRVAATAAWLAMAAPAGLRA
ncbi:MAG: hypothetical protein GEV11_08280 [Streptosporangiales bacterium]|nr:hypothetical protein [Streptosporangiales bacterium]